MPLTTAVSLKKLRREYWITRRKQLGQQPPPTEEDLQVIALARNHKLTRSEYEAMHARQRHCCLICNRHASAFKRRLCVDHDHTTGKVRGLLCNSCNVLLGYARESPYILRMCALYLEIHALTKGSA